MSVATHLAIAGMITTMLVCGCSLDQEADTQPQPQRIRIPDAEASRIGPQPFGGLLAADSETLWVAAGESTSHPSFYAYSLQGNAWGPLPEVFQSDSFPYHMTVQGHTAMIAVGDFVEVYELDNGIWAHSQRMPTIGLVALDGDTAVVGLGDVDIFDRKKYDVWALSQTIVAPESCVYTRAIDLRGDYLIVGSDGAGDPRGDSCTWNESAHIYHREGRTWVLEQALNPPMPQSERFGWSVALAEDTAVIGAPWAAPDNAGAVYVYKRINGSWSLSEVLRPSAPDSEGRFGWRVKAKQSSIMVSGHGAASLFREEDGNWIEESTIRSQTLGFGEDIALTDEYAFVGSPNDLCSSTQGAVYAFPLRFQPSTLDASNVSPETGGRCAP